MIYLVRHGETVQNKAGLMQGRSDFPLNERGEEQARLLGRRFRQAGIRFDAVYASPLRRAVQTAALIAGEDTDIRVDERLIEMDYGPYEGMDLRAPAPEVLAFFMDFVNVPAPAGMEPLPAVTERLGRFLEELRPACAGKKHPDLHPRHRPQGGAGIPDAGVEGELLGQKHRQLRRLPHGACGRGLPGANALGAGLRKESAHGTL